MKINKTLTTISGVMLLLAIPSIWPYGFYQILRWIICVTCVINAHRSYIMKLNGWTVSMIVVAVLFNPITPIYLSKGIWVLIDLAVACMMFVFLYFLKDRELLVKN